MKGEVLSLRTGPGLVRLFGLPFFAGGCFFIYGGLTADKINGVPPTVGTRIFFCAFASVFALFGAAILFAGVKVLIHRRYRRLKKVFGVFGLPLRTQREELADASQVSISREVRVHRTKNGTHTRTVYPVRIRGDSLKVDIEEPQNPIAARRTAERVAKHLELPLHDATGDHEVVRQTADLDMPLAERLARDGDASEPPLPDNCPVTTDTEYTNAGVKRFVINIPCILVDKTAARCVLALAWVAMAVIWAAWMWQRLQPLGTDSAGKLLHVGFIVLTLSVVLLGLLVAGLLHTRRVTIDRNMLRVTVRLFIFRRTRKMPVQELEELNRVDPHNLIAISDRARIWIVRAGKKPAVSHVEALLKWRLLTDRQGG